MQRSGIRGSSAQHLPTVRRVRSKAPDFIAFHPDYAGYTGYINARLRTTGHLWQGRFGSVVMDESHLFHAVRYVSLNPVRARLVPQAQDWRWSSVAAHLSGKDDKLVKVAPILDRYGNFTAFLGESTDDEPGFKHLRQSETTGRPLGSEEWIERLEKMTGNTLKPQKRGPKTKDRDSK